MASNGWSVLLVDDDFLIVELLGARLQAQGYEVATASNGLEAYAHVQKHAPDVIVCDVVMPKMDGPTFCRKMRGEGNKIPFLFLTAKGQPQDIVELLSAGADDYIVKPFEAAELLARLQSILRRFYPERSSVVLG